MIVPQQSSAALLCSSICLADVIASCKFTPLSHEWMIYSRHWIRPLKKTNLRCYDFNISTYNPTITICTDAGNGVRWTPNNKLGAMRKTDWTRKISLIFFGTHWIAMEINPSNSGQKATQKSKSAINAVIKCYIEIKLGSEIYIWYIYFKFINTISDYSDSILKEYFFIITKFQTSN